MRADSLAQRTLLDAAALVAFVAVAAGLSVMLGQDANWDLQNYHYYNPWAWVHDERGYAYDVAAAQLQTYHNPFPDFFFYQMVKEGWRPRVIAAVLAIPAGVTVFFLWKLLLVVFRDLSRIERWCAVGAAVAIGSTSAIGFGTLGTTMNEWPGAMFVIAALYVVVRALASARDAAIPGLALVVAGFLCGFATGAKFTYGVFAIGLCAAILLRGPWSYAGVRAGVWQASVFGVAVLAGTLATAGFWMAALWTHFRNPIFPYGNIWIKSPWWGEYETMARIYGPHTFTEWLVFPFTLAAPPPFYVAEVPLVDGRLPAVFALAIIVAVAAFVQRATENTARATRVATTRELTVIGVFFAVSFVVWTAQYSILRYLVPLACISGGLIVAMQNALLRPSARAPAAIMSAVMLVGTTVVADWWRIDFGRRWFDVRMPTIEKDALVLLATTAPMAYVLPSFPSEVRFLGINNSISDARRKTLMEETISRTIREHRGPIYVMSYPWGAGDAALADRRLELLPDACGKIETNMRTSPIQICRVARAADAR